MDSSPPVLWHITISHYSEKARWALSYKRVAYEARAPMPGVHMPLALWLTRGKVFTLPVLRIDGRTIGDSTAIIAALEEHRPQPALYPADAEQRRRALELEDWFDERLGPYARRLAFHEAAKDAPRMSAVAERVTPGISRWLGRLTAPVLSTMAAVRYGTASAAAAEAARGHVLAALDRIEAELGEREYLVGARFSVADLTAAALMMPVVLPPEGMLRPEEMPEEYQRWRSELSGRRGFRWVQEMFARHRHGGAQVAGAGSGAAAAGAGAPASASG